VKRIGEILISSSILLMTGCVGIGSLGGQTPQTKPPPDPKFISSEDLCEIALENYRDRSYQNSVYSEMEARKLFTDSEISLIRKSAISKGMSEKALECSWGTPDRKNTTTYSSGRRHVQYVYEHYKKRYYVYTEDGEITSWSKHEEK